MKLSKPPLFFQKMFTLYEYKIEYSNDNWQNLETHNIWGEETTRTDQCPLYTTRQNNYFIFLSNTDTGEICVERGSKVADRSSSQGTLYEAKHKTHNCGLDTQFAKILCVTSGGLFLSIEKWRPRWRLNVEHWLLLVKYYQPHSNLRRCELGRWRRGEMLRLL